MLLLDEIQSSGDENDLFLFILFVFFIIILRIFLIHPYPSIFTLVIISLFYFYLILYVLVVHYSIMLGKVSCFLFVFFSKWCLWRNNAFVKGPSVLRIVMLEPKRALKVVF